MPLHLEIVTAERVAYEGDVDQVIVPGSEGELGILPHHEPMVSLLGQGVLRVQRGSDEEQFAIFGGFLQVRPDRVVVLAETADMASEIDLERAQRARREAEHVLEGGLTEEADLISARAALQRALIRIRIAERSPRGMARGEHEAMRLHTSRPPKHTEPPGE
jgi:F-type H+-transporting ATPase subunit epsilon